MPSSVPSLMPSSMPSSANPSSELGSSSAALAAALGLEALAPAGAADNKTARRSSEETAMTLAADGVPPHFAVAAGRRGKKNSKWGVVRNARARLNSMREEAWREALAKHEQEVAITRIFGH